MRILSFLFVIALGPAPFSLAQTEPGQRDTRNVPPGQPQQPQQQDTFQRERRITGRILPPQGEFHLPSMAIVTITSLSGYQQTQMVRGDGSFEFKGLPGGSLTITLESPEHETTQQTVELDASFMGAQTYVLLTLGKRLENGDKAPVNADRRTISVAEMAIPKESMKELEKAGRESEKKRPEKAIVHLKKAIEIFPNNFLAYNNLAVQYLRLGKPEEALSSLEKAIELQPNNATAHRNLGLILLNQREYEKALGALRKSQELEPNSVETQMFLGEAYYNMSQFVLALGCFGKAAEIKPDHQLSFLRMGHCYVELGRVGDALRQFELFLAAEPKGERADQVRSLISQLRAQ